MSQRVGKQYQLNEINKHSQDCSEGVREMFENIQLRNTLHT